MALLALLTLVDKGVSSSVGATNKTSNPHQADMDKYKEKVEKIKNPEEKEKKSKAYSKLITNRDNARDKELMKNYNYASKYFNY